LRRQKKIEIKAQQALTKEQAKLTKMAEKLQKRRPRDGTDTTEDVSVNLKRQNTEDYGDIKATVSNFYDRPRLNFRRARDT
jgi:hypothetical protein